MTTYVAPTTEDLEAIAEQVWASYLDMAGTDPLIPLPGEALTVDVSASVSVTGAWQGHIVVSCSHPASRLAAGELLGVEVDDVTDADIADALGELANVVGGNVKAALPGPSRLGLPEVGAAPPAGDPADVCRVDVSWRGQPLTISVQGAPSPLPVAPPFSSTPSPRLPSPRNGASL
jgi:chemotaxis protein CheX